MNHLDEGTIHAWLDGAVDATRAREIEAHLAQCPACSSAIAEARGFVAGASRILNALDDVPAGVTPRRAVAPTRQWRASRWVTSIAAALVLAIGITTWNRGAVRDQLPLPMTTNPVLERLQGPTAPPPAAETAMKASSTTDSAPRPSVAAASERRDVVVTRKARAPQMTPNAQAVSKQARADEGRAVGGVTDASRANPGVVTEASRGNAGVVSDKSRANALTAGAAVAPSAAPAAPPVESRPRRIGDSKVQLSEIVVTSTGARQASPVSEADRLAGCYRVKAPSTAREMLRDAAGAASAVGGAAEAKRSARVAPAPARAPVSADFSATQAPALLRLDTLRRPLGFIVRSATSDTTIGWWNGVGTDSVRVDLLAAGVFTFAGKDRVACPEP